MIIEHRSDAVETRDEGGPGSGEVLSRDQMLARYNGEWLLIDTPDVEPSVGVSRGKVVWHSPNRDEVYRKAKGLRMRYGAFLYAGPVPGDDESEVVL